MLDYGMSSNERAVHLQRFTGALLLGLIPLLASQALPGGLAVCGVGLPKPGASLAFALALPVLLLPVLYFSVTNERGRAHYPQIRDAKWGRGLQARNVATWTVYLLGYEFFFRGFLLFALAHWLGGTAAVLFTTVLYAIAHLTKDPLECLATVPMGLILGAGALYTGGFWGPFAAHLGIAVVSETMAMKAR